MSSDNGVAQFVAAADKDIADESSRLISDGELEQVMTAAIRLYTRRAEVTERFPPPVSREATATEVVTVACEMIRVVDVNMFDLSMWYRRPRG